MQAQHSKGRARRAATFYGISHKETHEQRGTYPLPEAGWTALWYKIDYPENTKAALGARVTARLGRIFWKLAAALFCKHAMCKISRRLYPLTTILNYGNLVRPDANGGLSSGAGPRVDLIALHASLCCCTAMPVTQI